MHSKKVALIFMVCVALQFFETMRYVKAHDMDRNEANIGRVERKAFRPVCLFGRCRRRRRSKKVGLCLQFSPLFEVGGK